MTEKKARKCCGWGLTSAASAFIAATIGWILYSKRYIDHHAKLKIILEAEQHTFESDTAGKINYFVNGIKDKTPILLVHGLHMSAGLHDMLPIFDAFRTSRLVYSIDLPGFGGSEKTDRPYRPSLYSAAITDFIKNKIGQPCHVVTLGNSSEYAAVAAHEEPDLFKSIIMINPSGFEMPDSSSISRQDRAESFKDILLSLLKIPLWSLPLYDAFVSRANITKWYTKRFSYDLPGELIDLAYTSAHQPGAHFAPMVFLSGKLKVCNVREKFYEKVSVPVLAVYDNEPGMSFDMLPQLVREHSNWKAFRSRHSKGMPHFESSGELFRQFDLFWKENS